MVTNASLYLEPETLSKMSEEQVSVEYVYQTSLLPECMVGGDNLKSLKKDSMKSTSDGQYSSLLHLYLAANVIEINTKKGSFGSIECTQDMKTADSVLLSLFMKSTVKCYTPHAP